MLRLTVHIHQGFTNFGLNTQTDRSTVHPGDRATLSPDLTPEPQPVRLFQQALPVQQFVDELPLRSLQAEEPFHNCPVCPFADAGCVHPRAKDRSQGIQDDGLPGTSLTSKDHQSGGELECQIIDNRKIADAQFFQHNPSKTQASGLSISRG